MTRGRDDYFKIHRQTVTDTGLRDVTDIGILQEPAVMALAKEIEPELRRWTEEYPAIPRNRIPSVSLTYAATCLSLGRHVMLVTAKVTLLLFAIDDIVDGAIVPLSDDDATTFLRLCRDLVVSKGNVDIEERTRALTSPLPAELVALWNDTALALQRYCAALDELARADIYYPFFARMFVGAMEGMIFEVNSRRRFIEAQAIPSYDEYMDAGKKSIASPIVCAAMLSALGPDIDPMTIKLHAHAMDEFAYTGGACVRLANDVRSFAREAEVEKRPNSMMILLISDQLSEAAAEAEVIRRANDALLEMTEQAKALPNPLARWARSSRSFTALMRDWYMVREFHD